MTQISSDKKPLYNLVLIIACLAVFGLVAGGIQYVAIDLPHQQAEQQEPAVNAPNNGGQCGGSGSGTLEQGGNGDQTSCSTHIVGCWRTSDNTYLGAVLSDTCEYNKSTGVCWDHGMWNNCFNAYKAYVRDISDISPEELTKCSRIYD